MTIADFCKLIHSEPSITADYKDALTHGKASDLSVRDVARVLELRAAWEELKARLTLICDREGLDCLSDADMAVHRLLDARVEVVIADEKIG